MMSLPPRALVLVVSLLLLGPGFAAGDSEQQLLRGEAYLTQGLWPLAEESLVRALTEAPRSADGDRIRRRTLSLLSDICRRSGRRADALEYGLLLQSVLKGVPAAIREPIAVDSALRLAEDYMAVRMPSAARELLDELLAGKVGTLKAVPRLSALVKRASAEEAMERAEAARPYWEQTIRQARELLSRYRNELQSSERVDCLRSLLSAHEALHETANADRTRDELIKFVHANPALSERDVWIDLAAQRTWRQDEAGAAELYQRALDATPPADYATRTRLHAQLGDLWRTAGNDRRAEAEFRLAIADCETLIKSLRASPTGKESLPGLLKQLRLLYQRIGPIYLALHTPERPRMTEVAGYPNEIDN